MAFILPGFILNICAEILEHHTLLFHRAFYFTGSYIPTNALLYIIIY